MLTMLYQSTCLWTLKNVLIKTISLFYIDFSSLVITGVSFKEVSLIDFWQCSSAAVELHVNVTFKSIFIVSNSDIIKFSGELT